MEVYNHPVSEDVLSRIKREVDGATFAVRTGVTHAVLATYYRLLAQCVESGISLQQSLGSLETQTGMKPELVRVTEAVRTSLSQGQTFTEAVSPFPNVFSPLAIGLIQVGENIGALGANLKKLGDIHEQRHRTFQAVVKEVTYPLLLVMMAAYVVPVPLIFMQGFSAYVLAMIPRTLGFLLAGALIVLGPAVARALFSRRAVHAFGLQLPVFGAAYRQLCLARFSRALGSSISAGVEMGKSVELALRATSNAVIEDRIEAQMPVIQREGLGPALVKTGLFKPEQTSTVDIGERTGNLGANLLQLADACEEDGRRTLGYGGKILGFGLFALVVVISILSVLSGSLQNMQHFGEGFEMKLRF